MTEDETELELKCADLGRNEKLMPLNSDQASWIIFLPMKDSSLISSARITLLSRPSSFYSFEFFRSLRFVDPLTSKTPSAPSAPKDRKKSKE